MTTPFSDYNSKLEREAVKHITQKFGEYKCLVQDMRLPEFLATIPFIPEQKKLLLEWKGSKYDLIVNRPHTSEFYLVECKGKSKDLFRMWVNKDDYDAYFSFRRDGTPFLYFIWVKENDKIYRHDITTPKDFEEIEDRDGKAVYLIPTDKIHEIDPDEYKRMDMWMSGKRLERMLIKILKT